MRNQAFISGLAILLYFSPLSCQSVEFTTPEFREVIAENAQVVAIATELQFTEGPVWIDSSAGKPGYFLFSDIPANIIYRFSPGDTLSVWRSPSGNSNGLILDAAGRLITCEHGNRRVGISDVPGPVTTLCESYRGLALNSPMMRLSVLTAVSGSPTRPTVLKPRSSNSRPTSFFPWRRGRKNPGL